MVFKINDAILLDFPMIDELLMSPKHMAEKINQHLYHSRLHHKFYNSK